MGFLVYIYYSVNGENQSVLNIPYPRSKRLTDILLPSGVTYNDDISVQLSIRNITATSETSIFLQYVAMYKCNESDVFVYGVTTL